MAWTDYTYQFADFPEGWCNPPQFVDEIRESDITVAVAGVAVDEQAGQVTVTFKAALSTDEQTLLDNLVAAHHADAGWTLCEGTQTIVIDDSSDKTIVGTWTFDHQHGGRLVLPVEAALPQQGTATGEVVRVGDKLWVWDGSAWIELAPQPPPTVRHTYSDDRIETTARMSWTARAKLEFTLTEAKTCRVATAYLWQAVQRHGRWNGIVWGRPALFEARVVCDGRQVALHRAKYPGGREPVGWSWWRRCQLEAGQHTLVLEYRATNSRSLSIIAAAQLEVIEE